MQIVCFQGDTYVLTPQTELDLATADRLSVALSALPGRRFIVDLSKVAFADRSGAARLAREARERPLTFVADDPRIVRILDIADRSLIVHPLLADALAA